jgi:hypothetical protein
MLLFHLNGFNQFIGKSGYKRADRKQQSRVNLQVGDDTQKEVVCSQTNSGHKTWQD